MHRFVYRIEGRCRLSNYPAMGAGAALTISSAVGLGGSNRAPDVRTVQQALNCVPAVDGGPSPQLAVDGIVGPKTLGAIRTFQTVQFPMNAPDSRVDPGQRTLRRLQVYAAFPSLTPAGESSAALNWSPISWWPAARKAAQDATPRALDGVRDALRQLAEVRRFYAEGGLLGGLVMKVHPVVREANWHFKFHADPDRLARLARIDKVMGVYKRAAETLNRELASPGVIVN